MIEIRRARLDDVQFIRELAIESVVYGIPDSKDVTNDSVRLRAAESLKTLEQMVLRRSVAALLIAVDTEWDSQRVGYLILEFDHVDESTGEKQSFIFDAAVLPEYWGKYVLHHMVWEAARLSHQRGLRYMAASVSASNQRALLTGIKLGFEVERHTLVMGCGPDGAAPMPGRPPHERAHQVSRLKRLSTRRQRSDEPGK